jgi:hypothetical protein
MSESRNGHHWLSPLVTLLLAGGLAACASAHPGAATAAGEGESGDDSVVAHFEISSSGLARGEITPTHCNAGDLSHFLGADLVDDGLGLAVRLVIDPLYGPALRVFDLNQPYERSVIFFEEECERFDLDFEPTGWMINEVEVRDLTLEVDCMNEDGATISGAAHGRCD